MTQRETRKSGRTMKLTGTRILTREMDSDALAREFLDDTSSNPSRFYTRVGDVSTAFSTNTKKKLPDNETLAPKEPVPSVSDYYSDEDDREFDEQDYRREMIHYGIEPSEQGNGCNHDALCQEGCRLYHDLHQPRRKHYIHETGTTSYEKSRYGRFVREYRSTNMIRLDDDQDSTKNSRFTAGWHHSPSCKSNCTYYHYEGSIPDRYARLTGGVFHKTQCGRWITEWVNGEMAYIRLGPNNDDSEPGDVLSTSLTIAKMMETNDTQMPKTNKKKEKEKKEKKEKNDSNNNNNNSNINKKKKESTVDIERTEKKKKRKIEEIREPIPLSFRSMTKDELTTYFKEEIKDQDMAINEIVRIMMPLQKPLTNNENDEDESENQPSNMIKILASGGTEKDRAALMASMRRLFDMQKGGVNEKSFVAYPLEEGEKKTTELVSLINSAILNIRAIERKIPLDIEDQSLILFLSVTGLSKETFRATERLIMLLNDNTRLSIPDDIFLVLCTSSSYGEKILNTQSHDTLKKAVQAITNEIASINGDNDDDMMDELGAIVPFFDHSITKMTMTPKEKKKLINSAVRRLSMPQYSVAGIPLILEESETRKLVEYIISSPGNEQTLFEIAKRELEYGMEAMDTAYTELFESHPLFAINATRKNQANASPPVILFDLIPPCKSLADIGSAYPHMKKVLKNPNYKAIAALCVENQWSIPYFVFRHDKYLNFHVYLMNPVTPITSSTTTTTTTTKRKRSEEKEDSTESSSPTTKKKVAQHDWKEDELKSNRKSKVYKCSCPLEEGEHYRRSCSARIICEGDGYKKGITKGYCSLCQKKGKK